MHKRVQTRPGYTLIHQVSGKTVYPVSRFPRNSYPLQDTKALRGWHGATKFRGRMTLYSSLLSPDTTNKHSSMNTLTMFYTNTLELYALISTHTHMTPNIESSDSFSSPCLHHPPPRQAPSIRLQSSKPLSIGMITKERWTTGSLFMT